MKTIILKCFKKRASTLKKKKNVWHITVDIENFSSDSDEEYIKTEYQNVFDKYLSYCFLVYLLKHKYADKVQIVKSLLTVRTSI